MTTYTLAQINKKYKDVYIEFTKSFDTENSEWGNPVYTYTVHKTSKVIKENMTLGQDVGTELAYRR